MCGFQDIDVMTSAWLGLTLLGTTRGLTSKSINGLFQSTPPRGGRRAMPFSQFQELQFQSTPPHGGRLQVFLGRSGEAGVSIHTPTRGATPKLLSSFLDFVGFNPHPHAGGDMADDSAVVLSHVSIHTPTRGATHVGL